MPQESDLGLVVCGPWIGEFAGELEAWHAWLRHIRHTMFKDNEFICISYPGRKILYEFASDFWELPDDFMEAINAKRIFPRWASVVNAETNKLLGYGEGRTANLASWVSSRVQAIAGKRHVIRIIPGSGATPQLKEALPRDQEFKLLRTDKIVPMPQAKIISIFPRDRPNETWRNWSAGAAGWQSLVQAFNRDGYCVIAHGAKNDSLDLGNSTEKFGNCVGRPLEDQVAYLQRSIIAITPICGAIRFAAFTGVPTLTFGNLSYIEGAERDEHKPVGSNPFGTKLVCLAKRGQWNYTPEEVKFCADKLIKELKV